MNQTWILIFRSVRRGVFYKRNNSWRVIKNPLKSKKYTEQVYHKCIVSCSYDSNCVAECSRKYSEEILFCPCQIGCPNGCPCTEYTCSTTTFEVVPIRALSRIRTFQFEWFISFWRIKHVNFESVTARLRAKRQINFMKSLTKTTVAPRTNVLILNTRFPSNQPVITNADGLENRIIDFEFGEDTEVWGSCSLAWQNNHYIFGGGVKVVELNCFIQRVII